MNRKISLGGAVTLAIMFSTVTFIITMLFASQTFDSKMFNIKERETMYAKLSEIDRLVRQNYLGEVDETALNDALAAGYLEGIGDEYGMYLTAEQYARIVQDYEGKTVDVGISCVQDASGYIRVSQVYAESPAESAGLQQDDLIVRVDQLAVTGETFASAVEALKGEPGTEVTLVVRRGGEEMEMTIARRKIDVPTVTYRLIDTAGYVRITEFNDNTPEQFKRAIDYMLEQQVDGLVFDVRGNPGGTIEAVCQILDILLPEGVIASATYKTGETEVLAYSDANEVTLPMMVLTNSHSASAAELFAQALKDYGKARTVGTTTYGKGAMQSIYKLSDGSALDLTVALYNPPRSGNFNGVGVKADYEVTLTAEQEANLWQLDENSDPQLKKALELLEAAVRAATSGGDNLAGETEFEEAQVIDESGEEPGEQAAGGEPADEGAADGDEAGADQEDTGSPDGDEGETDPEEAQASPEEDAA